MQKYLRKLKKDIRGAVTVMVTLLLIPALLVTGTGVDLATMFAARSVVRNSNELALNAVMSDYDQLLRDLYGLFAVTAGDPELQAMVNKYISLTLFGEASQTEGRVLYNNVAFSSEIVPVDDANLMNQSILRRQIEEYVRLRAPTFLVEEVLDRLEAFTRFLPDLSATIQKLNIVMMLDTLRSLQQQLYYRIFYHDSYISMLQEISDFFGNPEGVDISQDQIQFWLDNAERGGLEVNHAEMISIYLLGIVNELNEINDSRQKFFELQQTYNDAVRDFNLLSMDQPSFNSPQYGQWLIAFGDANTAMIEARGQKEGARTAFYGLRDNFTIGDISNSFTAPFSPFNISNDVRNHAINGGNVTLGGYAQLISNWHDIVLDNAPGGNILRWVLSGTTTVFDPIQLIASFHNQHISLRNTPLSVEAYLNNLAEMQLLFPLIEMQAQGILDAIDRLEHFLINYTSATMREGMLGVLEEMRPSVEIAGVNAQFNVIYNSIQSYFFSYADYLLNPDIILSNNAISDFTDIRNIVSNLSLDNSIVPPEFTALLGSMQAIPYFMSDKQNVEFMHFTEDHDSFIFFVTMYDMFGEVSYFMHTLMEIWDGLDQFRRLFGNGFLDVIRDLSQGIEYRTHGASAIPSDVFDLMMSSGDISGSLADSNQITESPSMRRIVQTTIDNLNSAYDLFTLMFILQESMFSRLSLVTYASGMFSAFTTQDGTSFAGHDFHPNVNFLLGSELEYILIGNRSATINLLAFSGILFATRFVFNLMSSFIHPTVSAITGADPTQITRAIYVFGETMIDVVRLRAGESIPIVKFMNNHWFWGNPTVKAAILASYTNTAIFGTANAAISAALGVAMNSISGMHEQIMEFDSEKFYKSGLVFAGLYRSVSSRGLANVTKGFFDELSGSFGNGGFEAALEEWRVMQIDEMGGLNMDTFKRQWGDDFAVTQWDAIVTNGNVPSPRDQNTVEKFLAGEVEAAFNALVSLSYENYLSIFLFLTSSEVLTERIQHLITLNMTNTVQNAATPVPSKPNPLLPWIREPDLTLDSGGVFDLYQAHTAFVLDTEVDLDLLFLSGFIAQGRAGDVSSSTLTFNTISKRGY